MSALNFPSPVKKVVEVSIGEDKFKLYEPSGAVSDDYRRKLAKCTKVEDGKVKVDDPGAVIGAGKELVAACLKDSSGNSVLLTTIQDWPGTIGDALVAAVLDFIPKDTPEDVEAAKNSLGAMTAGSV